MNFLELPIVLLCQIFKYLYCGICSIYNQRRLKHLQTINLCVFTTVIRQAQCLFKGPHIHISGTKRGLKSCFRAQFAVLHAWQPDMTEHECVTDVNKGLVFEFRELLALLLCWWCFALRWNVYFDYLEILRPLSECKSVMLWPNRRPS